MPQGTCARWFADRAYGFIEPDDKGLPEVFVHRARLADGVNRLAVDQRVEFQIELNRAGKPQARKVTILGSNSVPSLNKVRRASPGPTTAREKAEALFHPMGERNGA